MQYPNIGAMSGQVMTVLGQIPANQMGVTLMHEHILFDGSWRDTDGPISQCSHGNESRNFEKAIDIGVLGELRNNPFFLPDNWSLRDVDVAVEELCRFVEAGGSTVVDPTNVGIGRNPNVLQHISRRTGLNIIMGSGFYLEPTHPKSIKTMSVDDIAETIVHDCGGASERPNVCAGIIGEIGVSEEFTAEEEKVLRGASRASRITTVPMTIHLMGWARCGDHALDIIESEGGDPHLTILCHMNPSHADHSYHERLAKRGAFLEFDMIGMEYFFPPKYQCPSDEETATAICRLLDLGYIDSVLLSQDVFMKMMLCRYGGNGYAHILRHFVPRLRRHGVSQTAIDRILINNPRCVFSGARMA